MNKLFYDLSCKHIPKKYKKIGVIFDFSCEILVCEDCKNNPDIQNFQEEAIQN